MTLFRLTNLRTGQSLGGRVARAATARERTKGLLSAETLMPGEGLHIVRCSAIHTFFMRFAIDVAFLDGQERVVKLFRALPPFRFAVAVGRGKSVLEVPVGTFDRTGTDVGDALRFQQV